MTFVTPGGRRVRVDLGAIAKAASTVIDTNTLDTDGLKDTFINSRTDAQICAFMKNVLSWMFTISPPTP